MKLQWNGAVQNISHLHMLPCSRSQGHLARTQPDAISLYTLATAHLSQNRLVLDVTLVIGVDGVGDVKRLFQGLAGAGVKHRPLQRLA